MKSEPTAEDLAQIDDEWPLIEAELDLLDVQLKMLDRTGPVDGLEVRRLRHARTAVIRETVALFVRRSSATRRAA